MGEASCHSILQMEIWARWWLIERGWKKYRCVRRSSCICKIEPTIIKPMNLHETTGFLKQCPVNRYGLGCAWASLFGLSVTELGMKLCIKYLRTIYKICRIIRILFFPLLCVHSRLVETCHGYSWCKN